MAIGNVAAFRAENGDGGVNGRMFRLIAHMRFRYGQGELLHGAASVLSNGARNMPKKIRSRHIMALLRGIAP